AQWPRNLRMRRPTPEDAKDAGVDSTWFVFSAVRDPRERLWSAWQSKFLVRRRRYVDEFGDESWFPRVPVEPSQVIEDFARFVGALTAGATDLMRSNVHFRGQARTVLDAPFDVAHLYEVRDIPTLLDDVGAHLRPYDVSVPELRRDNTTPLKLTADVLAGGVDETIVDLYRDDFDRLGHLWPEEPRTVSSSSWSEAAFLDISSRVALHERVEDLSIIARDMRKQRTALQAQANG
ncbi:MAG: sulfotransferase family protein, partial [Actinomycetia bacterium]|nr:sulfotransferase family protein [Actinomycetes bacterium]